MTATLPALTGMTPRLAVTLAGNPGGRVMQSFSRAPWSDEYFVAYVDAVHTGQASDLRIARCDSSGKMLDYAILDGGGHGASITTEYEGGQVWVWLFWGSDVASGAGTAVRWAYQGSPTGVRVLLSDAETVYDPGAGDPAHVHGHFAIDQAADRIATSFRSGTVETYTLYDLSDYKAGTATPLKTVSHTWPTGDKSAFQGFTTSDTKVYASRGGSQPSDQPPTLYELDWTTGAITATKDISQLALVNGLADGGHNEAEGVCLWRDQSGNPTLLFGLDTGPLSNRRGLVYRLAEPVDGTATKTVQIDAERVIDGPATNVVAAFSYDRTVRYTTGGFTPTGYADPVKLSEQSTAVLNVSDHPDLTDDSFGFVIHVKLAWDDPADPGRRKTATYTAQLSAADPAVVNLSQALVATGAVAPGQVIAGAPGHSPTVTMVGDQIAVDGVTTGPHLTADATAAQQAAAQSAQAAAASAALVGAPAGTAIDAHTGPSLMLSGSGDQTAAITSFLGASTPLGVKKLIGPANIASTITIPAGTYVDASQASFTYTGTGGVAVKVSGVVVGLTINYPQAAAGPGHYGLNDVGFWLMPGSESARCIDCTVTGLPGSGFAVGGANDTTAGAASHPMLVRCTANDGDQYAFRIDESTGLVMEHCVGMGAGLDVVKLRFKVTDFLLFGGRYSGARGGDGLDGFSGANKGALIGCSFFNNAQNGFVFKTDNDAANAVSQADWMAIYGWPEMLTISGVRCWSNGGAGATIHRSDGTDSDVLTYGRSIGLLQQVNISDLMCWDNGNHGLAINARGVSVNGAQLRHNGTAATTGLANLYVYQEARNIALNNVHCYGAGVVGGVVDDFRILGQKIYATNCWSYGVGYDDMTLAKDDATLDAVPAANRYTRYGWAFGSTSDVHLSRCGARWPRLSAVSAPAGCTVTYDGCRMENPDGTLFAGTAGRVFSASQQVGWRHELVAGSPIYSTALKMLDAGGKSFLTVGDAGSSGFDYLVLAAKAGGAVQVASPFNPQYTNTYDLGTNSVQWRDVYHGGMLKNGTKWLDLSTNPPRYSADAGATWKTVTLT